MTNTTPFPEHPSLRDPTLVSVVFEMEFEGDHEVDRIARGLQQELNAEFPRLAQRLGQRIETKVDPEHPESPEISVTLAPPPPNEAHFKLFSDEHGREVRVGPAFFQFLNTNGYPGWTEFSALLARVLKLHHEMAAVSGYKALKLVYANRMPWVQGAENQVFQPWLLPKTPEVPDAQEIVGNQQTLTIRLPDGYQEISVTFPGVDEGQPDERTMQFDIDHYLLFTDVQSAVVDDLIQWTDLAHERIYQTFRCALVPEFLEARA